MEVMKTFLLVTNVPVFIYVPLLGLFVQWLHLRFMVFMV